MTLHEPAEPETVNTIKSQTEPQYKKELRTEIIAGIEFSQYDVKPLTADETDNSAPPLSTAQTTEIITPSEPPILKHLPDDLITVTERNDYGYTRPELLPLTKDRAITLFKRDMTIYLLYKDNTEAIARYISDIQNHDGIFGVAYGAWQNSREYIALASGNPEDILEAKFIFDGGDSFAIYQTEPDGSPNAYKSYEELEQNGLDIDRRKYNLVYTAPLPAPPSDNPAGLFMWVNGGNLRRVAAVKPPQKTHYANRKE